MAKTNSVSNFFLLVERVIRWFIFLTTIGVMFYLLVHSLMLFFATGTHSLESRTPGADLLGTHLAGWKFFRNNMYLLLMLDLPIIGISVFVREKAGDITKGLRSVAIWFGLLLFVTFSYALAGLAFDLILVAYTFQLLGTEGMAK